MNNLFHYHVDGNTVLTEDPKNYFWAFTDSLGNSQISAPPAKPSQYGEYLGFAGRKARAAFVALNNQADLGWPNMTPEEVEELHDIHDEADKARQLAKIRG